MDKMSQLIPEKVKAAVGAADVKQRQLAENIIEPTKNSRITTDYGVKQSNTDNWLRVNRPDQTGPMLLEDPNGREKVHYTIYILFHSHN